MRLAIPERPREVPQQGSRRLGRLLNWNVLVAVEVLALLLLWQVAVGNFRVWDPAMMPPPSDIGLAFIKMLKLGTLTKNLWFSAQNFVAGYFLASAVGLSTGLLLGSSRLLDSMLSTFVWTINAVPRIALVPLLVLWMGFGHAPKILVIFLMAVFPVLINAREGVRTVEPSLIRAGRVFGAKGIHLYLKVILPAALPLVLTGLRLGVARSLIGVVVGELEGSAAGLGFMIERASANFDMSSALAVTLLLVVAANASMAALSALKRRLAPWDEEGVRE